MPRKPPPARRPENSRLQTYIAGHIHDQVTLYCAQRNWHESTFFEAASLCLLEGTGDKEVLYRRLAALDRRLHRIDDAVQSTLILVHLFVEVWFERAHRNTPDGKRAHRTFMDQVAAKARARTRPSRASGQEHSSDDASEAQA
jgi:hypothetical protein